MRSREKRTFGKETILAATINCELGEKQSGDGVWVADLSLWKAQCPCFAPRLPTPLPTTALHQTHIRLSHPFCSVPLTLTAFHPSFPACFSCSVFRFPPLHYLWTEAVFLLNINSSFHQGICYCIMTSQIKEVELGSPTKKKMVLMSQWIPVQTRGVFMLLHIMTPILWSDMLRMLFKQPKDCKIKSFGEK